MPKLSIIIPCYFNGEHIPITKERLIQNESLFEDNLTFEYVMVDDVSKDNTVEELIKFIVQYPEIVKVAGSEFSPAIIANYAYELVKLFNHFLIQK